LDIRAPRRERWPEIKFAAARQQLNRHPPADGLVMVGATGIEPVTPTMST
jgi:hypothetical protein